MREIVRSAYGDPVISDYVFDETVTVTLVKTRSVGKARAVGESLLDSFRVLRVDEPIFRRAWRRFANQKGTRFSFTDSTTIVLMEENGIGHLATFDREFSSVAPSLVGPS